MTKATRHGRRLFRDCAVRLDAILGCLCALVLLPPFPQDQARKADAIISAETDLSLWGLSDPTEIGYVSIVISHLPSGDELKIQAVRRSEPVLHEPEGPRGRIPEFAGDVFLLDHFISGNVNRLGGTFLSFSRQPSSASIAIAGAGERKSLTFSYSRHASGFAGFGIRLFNSRVPPAERYYLDTTPFRYVVFSIRGESGQERLSFQVSDRSWHRREDSVKIGDLGKFLPAGKITRYWQAAWIPLDLIPARIDRNELAGLAFLAQQGVGKTYLKDAAFTITRDAVLPEPEKTPFRKNPLRRAMWLWKTRELLGNPRSTDELMEFCRRHRITDLFLQLPYSLSQEGEEWSVVWDKKPLAHLLRRLHRTGLTVHALDGDPHFALTDRHGQVIATLEAIIRYNRSAEADARFDGVRYDIEPYLLPAFAGIQKHMIIRQYLNLLETLKGLADPAGLTLGADIPFWFDGRNRFFEPIAEIKGRPLSEWIIDIVDNIGIMDYRTFAYGSDGTIAHGKDELEYASSQNKQVFLGLETVPLPDETIMEFTPGAGDGVLAIRKLAGTSVRMTWIPPGVRVTGNAGHRLFRKSRIPVPAGKITFAEKSPSELTEVIDQTVSEVGRYSGFCGIAIHSYESYRPWLEKTRKHNSPR